MSPETEDQRNSRIRDDQLQNRTFRVLKKPRQGVAVKTRSAPNKPSHADKSPNTPPTGPLNLPLGGLRDVVIGLALGLLPAIVIIVALPGALKLLAPIVLVIAGIVGYLLGAAPPR